MTQARHRLDDLLASLPSPLPDPPARAIAKSGVSENHWEQMLRSTLERIDNERQNGQPARSDANASRHGEFDVADVLRTPLPIEAGEPREFALEAGQALAKETAGFSELFEREIDDFDPLRAPLKSGEHAQLKPELANAAPTNVVALAQPPSSRRAFYWVCGGATTLAAAAALTLFVRTQQDAKPSPLAANGAATESAVTATTSPQGLTEIAKPVGAVTPESAPQVANLGNVPARALDRNGEPLPAEQEAAANASTAAKATKLAKVSAATTKGQASPERTTTASRVVAEPDELSPAAGPATVPDHPAIGAISAAFAPRAAEAKRCLATATRRVPVRVTFGSSGKVLRVVVLDSATSGTERSCVESALGTMRVAPFARSEFDAPLTISNP